MLEDIQQIHFIGAGGIGVSAAAKWCLAQEKKVTGSDATRSKMTEDLEHHGIKIFLGHASDQVHPDLQLVVYSPAVPDTNVERVRAKELGILEWSYPEFLGAMSKEYSTIVVSGTNGKSTTTAMLGLILEAAGYDPTVIVGSLVPRWKEGNLRVGGGRFFVVEGCEYKAAMLQLNPEMIVLTNIEEDHLDYYRDLDHIRETFQIFADKLKGKGMIVLNVDDPESQKLVTGHQTTFGFETGAYNTKTHDLRLKIPGRFNQMNALAATAAAMELGVPFETCKRVLESFTGIWRRFERVGVWRGAEVISDYGHHPTAIRGTLEAARQFFPGRRIVLCFQPHQHARTLSLLAELVEALKGADVLVVSEIYSVEGRTEVEIDRRGPLTPHRISSHDLVSKIPGSHYVAHLGEAEKILNDLIQPNDVLIVQGAGDIDDLARRLVL